MNNKKVLIAILIVFLVLGLSFLAVVSVGIPLLSYTGSASMESFDSAPMMSMDYYDAVEHDMVGEYMDGEYYEERGVIEDSAPDANRDDYTEGEKKIWRGDMNLIVENLEESTGLIEEKAVQMGGFISDSSVNHRERSRTASITLRVPVQDFRNLMAEVAKVGELESSSTSGEDVTRQYIDLEARLKNLTAQEERLLEILEMGETVEEVLMVERELQRIRGEIEVLTANFNYLKSSVNLSTVTVFLTESVLASPGVTSPKMNEIISNGYRSLVNSVNGILVFGGELIIFTMGAVPYLLMLAVMVVVVVVLIRRARGKKDNASPPAVKNDNEPPPAE